MRILGIDPGTERCGYAVIEDDGGRPVIVQAGTIEMPHKDSLAERLGTLHAEILHLLSDFTPQAIGVETPYVGKFASAAIGVSQARGAVVGCLGARGFDVIDVSPSEAKHSVGAGGGAPKDAVRECVRLLFGLETLPGEDTADALAIAFAASSRARDDPLTPPKVVKRAKRKAWGRRPADLKTAVGA